MTRWLNIVGIGEDGLDGLSPAARALVDTAEMLVGGARQLAMVPPGAAGRLLWRRPLADTISDIDARRGRRVTVLASGDPMWYGVGVLLARHFSRAEMTVVPQPSAFSLAAARLGWPLAECAALSLHGRPLDSLHLHLSPGRHLLILSEDGMTPRRVAALLVACGWGQSRMTVLAHLGGDRETVQCGSAAEWSGKATPDLNTIALECAATPGVRPLSRQAGLPDDAFEHDGQLTKREVRAATLARLAPMPGETLWDIGAGCGSIAIEWLRAADLGAAVAVEKNPARAAMIARNATFLGVPQLQVVPAEAPATIDKLPPADAIFVGGGIADCDLLPALWQALGPGGRLVANVVSSEGERAVLDWQARHGGDLVRIAVSRCEPVAGRHIWRSLAVVTQLAATKPA
jgi:precorrin-6B C5,15-methyltransferase / cobalt-precorrin-6B C5,C15-methyltransferase